MIARSMAIPRVRVRARTLTIAALPLILASLGALALGGCSSSPRGSGGESLGRESAKVTAESPGPIRQISRRSPYGDIAASHNLLLDGDLELEQGAFSPAWWMLNADGSYAPGLAFQSGGRCRSGLYCADVQVGQEIFNGYGAVRPGTTGTLTFAAKPGGACSDVKAELDLYATADGTVYDPFVPAPTSSAPGPDGWCTYSVRYTADRHEYQSTNVWMQSASETLFDDVVLLETPEEREVARSESRAGDPGRGRELAARHQVPREVRERGHAPVSPRRELLTRGSRGVQ